MSTFCARFHTATALALAGWIMAGLPGCGQGGPATYPVEGKVVYVDGTPFPGGLIEFESAEPASQDKKAQVPCARGPIQADGSFKLTTREKDDGAVAGRHRVLVRAPQYTYEWVGNKPPTPILNPKFERFETSGLEASVTEGKNELTITVTRP